MRLKTALTGALLLSVALLMGACGSGSDWPPVRYEKLQVRQGGTGQIHLAGAQRTLSFADSITVAVRKPGDDVTRWTLYTFFGLTKLDFRSVPSAVMVTQVDGRDPNKSSSTDLPSYAVGIVLHDGFNQGAVAGGQILAQDAEISYESVQTGSFVLEALANADGTWAGQTSPNRQARYVQVTLQDTGTGAEALVAGTVPFVITVTDDARFNGYLGNLGLFLPGDPGSGGPPPPPGTGGGGGTDGPPPPPGGGGTTPPGGSDGPPLPPQL